MALLHRGNGLASRCKSGCLILVDSDPLSPADREMVRYLEGQADTPSPVTAILDVMSEALLPAVEVNCGNPLAHLYERYGQVHCDRGLARASLPVSNHDHIGRTLYHDSRL